MDIIGISYMLIKSWELKGERDLYPCVKGGMLA